jgi:Family of unknown function (DUF6049)
MTRPRRRSLIAFVAPVVLTMLALGPLTAALAPQGAFAATADVTALPIQVDLSTLRPLAPQPGDTLVVTGTLHNVSDEDVANLTLDLQLSSAVGTRGEFDQYAADPNGDLNNLLPVTTPAAAVQTTLGPGESEPFELSLVLDQDERNKLLLSDAWQIRELGVSVNGTGDIESDTVGQLRTFLPWAPRNAVGNGVPTKLAWVWPLVDRPHRTASGVWFNDALAPEISPGGRLSGLLNAASNAEDQNPLGHNPRTINVPVTWAIDPLLVSDVNAMTTGYRVQAAPGTATGTTAGTATGTTAGIGTAAAKQWLPALKAAVNRADSSVISLPYADPDVVAAVRGAGFATTIGVATTNGGQELQKVLGTTVKLLPYGWPFDGLADQRSVNVLQATGDTALVLDGNAVPPTDGPPPATPSAHTLVTTNDGVVETLLTDPGLDADVGGGVGNPNGSRLSLQEFLAETLMIQRQFPTAPGDVVVAPGRRWNPAPSYAADLLADSGKVPWIDPVSLQTVRRSPVYTKVQRNPLTYPPSARRAELSPFYLDQVSALRSDINDFSAILPQGTPAIGSYAAAVQQALSSAWRDEPNLADAQVSALTASVRNQMNQVRITSNANSYVTLTSHGGNVPVTVSNNLDTPVQVTVELAGNPRLTLSRGGRVLNVSIAAHQQTLVHIHADARTSGVFPVNVQLLTPKGRPYGSTVRLYVRSTVYGTITLAITGAATLALLIAVAIRLTRRAMAARRTSVTADA